jgi:hypothetical protein
MYSLPTDLTITYESPLPNIPTTGTPRAEARNPYNGATVVGTFDWIRTTGFVDSNMPTVAESEDHTVYFTATGTDAANYLDKTVDGGVTTYLTTGLINLHVNKQSQTINLLTQPTGPGDLLKTESIALDMADYEVAWSPYADGSALCKITLSATTTALNPTPRRISFAIDTSTIATLGPVTEATTVDGFSKTTRELYFGYTSGSGGMLTGVVTVTISQNDANYNTITPPPPNTKQTYKIYIKKPQTASFTNITKTYGVGDSVSAEGLGQFNITPGLSSGLSAFTLTSDKTNVLGIVTPSGLSRTAEIYNVTTVVGDVKVTVAQGGYIEGYVAGHPEYVLHPENAYVAMTADIYVKILPKNATIKVNDLTKISDEIDTSVVYGSAINISYAYSGFTAPDAAKIGYLNSPIKNLLNTYVPADMKNVIRRGASGEDYFIYDPYTISPYGAENSNPDYPNYTFTYQNGLLTVTPKLLTATVSGREKVYGELNPAFPVSITGFITGEGVSVLGENAPASYFDPSEVSQFTNVGTYTVKIRGGLANNYNFDISSTATLKINQRPVTILYTTPDAVVYDGNTHPASAAQIRGLEAVGGTAPASTSVSYQYSADGVNWYSSPRTNAGTYIVRVTYNKSEEIGVTENYATTTADFTAGVRINPANPVINLSSPAGGLDYNSAQQPASATFSPIPGGVMPAAADAQGKSTTAVYQYKRTATADPYTGSVPVSVGTYDVYVTYKPAAVDNYKEYSAEFLGAWTIVPISVTVALNYAQLSPGGKKTATYSTDGFEPDRVMMSDSDFILSGAGSDSIPANRLTYQYSVNGEWKTEAPFNHGQYGVIVTYTALSGENYKTNSVRFEALIIIDQADIRQYLVNNAPERKTADYSAQFVDAYPINVSKIKLPGGSDATGTFSYEYRVGSQTFKTERPNKAGEYDVKVVYTTSETDNYYLSDRDSGVVYSKRVIINRIAPTIVISSLYRSEFTGTQVKITVRTDMLRGIPGGTSPLGTLSFEYWKPNDNGVYTWSTEGPINAGQYNVRARYAPATDDDYDLPNPIEYVGLITINKVRPQIYLNSIQVDYTGKGIDLNGDATLKDVDHFNLQIKGKSFDTVGPKGSSRFEYKLTSEDSSAWRTDPRPVSSGYYDIKVIFTPNEGTNYDNVEVTFYKALRIKNILPAITMTKIYTDYNGAEQEAKGASITNGVGDWKGGFTYEYNLGGNSWTSRKPTNAGVYDVRVRYTEGENDNYSSNTQEFPKYFEIRKAKITVTPIPSQFKIYDGNRVQSINFFESDYVLLGGYSWLGSLSAGDRDSDSAAGNYLITLGSLSAGPNYEIQFTGGVTYTIKPKEIEKLIFQNINNVFSASPKEPQISADPDYVVAGDSVRIYTRYDGDNYNVGTFRALAIMSERNYVLPRNSWQDYDITPARMSGNVYTGYEIPYDGQQHRLILSSVVSGASVFYNKPTEYKARGQYTVTATVKKPNYYDETLTATLTITIGVHNFTVYQPTVALYYGMPLPQLSTNISSEGKIFLNEGQVLMPGENVYNWTFVPNDLENYSVVTGTIILKVNKAKTELSVKGSLTQYIGDPENIQASVVSGDQQIISSAAIFYTSSSGEVLDSLPTAPGRYTMNVTFAGDDIHAPSSYSAIIIIKNKPNLWWAWALGGGVVVLIAFSAIFFSKKRNTIG